MKLVISGKQKHVLKAVAIPLDPWWPKHINEVKIAKCICFPGMTEICHCFSSESVVFRKE